MDFWQCVVYFLILGALSFIGGRLWPKSCIRWDVFPLAPFEFENNGKIYKKIGIAKWQSHVPDMSRVFTKIMPAKKITGRPKAETLVTMIKETCVAEVTHWLLILFGFGYLAIWHGAGGRICFILSVLVNLVFIVIQRYNRPRFVSLLERKTGAKGSFEERSKAECAF